MTAKSFKPAPETAASQHLSGEALTHCLGLIDFLRINQFKPRHVAANSWEVVVPSKNRTHTWKQALRRLRIFNDGTWTITLHFFPEFNEKITDETVINFVWNNLDMHKKTCHPNAENTCDLKQSIIIFGKPHDNMCCCCQIKITSPTGDALKHIKTLILTAREIIKTSPPRGGAL